LLRKRSFENVLEFLRIFRRNKMALIGSIVVIVWILVAIFASRLSPTILSREIFSKG